MGYSTDFEGEFKIDKPVDKDTAKLLKGLAKTRRMKRNVQGYGVEGEFYVKGKGFMGQDNDSTVIDSNDPPRTQPSLWCQWLLQDDNQTIKWDGGEKFYEYVDWIEYLINSVLVPKGYIVNGEVKWKGEKSTDVGKIIIKDNSVETKKGKVTITYGE